MDIYIMQHNYRNKHLVVIDSSNKQTSSTESIIINVKDFDTAVYVYKHEQSKFDQSYISFQRKHIFIGNSKSCEMTEFSACGDNKSDFDGNTLLLECEDDKYVYISGRGIFELRTDDKIKDYISFMGNNMIPYAVMVGEKYTYFLCNRYKFIENDKIEEGTLLNATNNSLNPFDYHAEKKWCALF